MDENYSLSDIASVAKGGSDGFGGGSAWWIIVLFLFAFMNGGLGFGNNAATGQDIQRAIDLSSIQNGQRDIAADVQRTTYETMATVKDAAYANLSEIRDSGLANASNFAAVQSALSNGFARQTECCCGLEKAILENRYLSEKNAADVKATVVAEANATRNMLQQNKIDALTAQVSELKTQNMFCGIPRINPYGYGITPNFVGNCGCGNLV